MSRRLVFPEATARSVKVRTRCFQNSHVVYKSNSGTFLIAQRLPNTARALDPSVSVPGTPMVSPAATMVGTPVPATVTTPVTTTTVPPTVPNHVPTPFATPLPALAPSAESWGNVMQELIGLQQSQQQTLEQLQRDQQRLQLLIQMVARMIVPADPLNKAK
ncbi:hypothetical protein N7540_000041 [Penicillium herquei]|nr:hypothetical protein N7540_000041 [Penicillium herquei]